MLLFWFHPDFDNSIEARSALKAWSEPLIGCAAPRVEDTAQRYRKPEAHDHGRPKAD